MSSVDQSQKSPAASSRQPTATSSESVAAPAPETAESARLIREIDRLRKRIGVLEEELVAQMDHATATILSLASPPRAGRSRLGRWTDLARGLATDVVATIHAMRASGGANIAARRLLAAWRIRRWGDFDAAFYVSQRGDLAGITLDPVQHYIRYGAAEGLDPSPNFSTEAYFEQHADVVAAGVDPYSHYVATGHRERRRVTFSRRLRRRAFGSGVQRVGQVRPDPSAVEDVRDPMAAWPLARSGILQLEALDPYDRRPDDAVIREGLRGEAFLQRFDLLGARPDFAAAAADLGGRLSAVAETPAVSIVIPVHGALGFTLNCLDALAEHASTRSFEIIVVDDASPDESGRWLPGIGGLVYLRQQTNGGFIAACNAGAKAARGETLVFLNNDTRVVEGWLDELCDGLGRLPNAGLIGSKLFYADGELQEAGGIIWRDGSAWNYGRNDDPNHPKYTYARQVDYVSGAAIALPRAVWTELDGFDSFYAPAYCEDSDLAFRVRRHGMAVWMQPLSRVIHYEGKTSGIDTTQGVKSYQVSNQIRFYERWRDVLASHRENGDSPALERERAVSKRVLVLDATTPTPDQDAGSVTTVKIIEVFQTLGYKVSFAPVDNFLFDPVYTSDLMRQGVECLYAPYVAGIEDLLATRGHEFDVVHVFRFSVLRECEAHIRRYCPSARLVFNNMDLHYLRIERQAKIENSAELAHKAQSLKQLELATMAKADVICVPSQVEADLLAAETLDPRVFVMPFMVDIHTPIASWAQRSDIVFLGGFGHSPNVDAALWLTKTLWPNLRPHPGSWRLILAGANPTPEILALASDDVIVPGRVDDLVPIFEKARVFVAPLRYGAGVKGKIYAAMAHGVPVVSTRVGVEGMGLKYGEEVLVADDPEALCRQILDIHGDPDLWARLSAAGSAFVRRSSTVEAGARVMREVLDAVGVEAAPSPPPPRPPLQSKGGPASVESRPASR